MQVQAMLVDNTMATIKTCHMLNPAILLPTEIGSLEHDCLDTIVVWLLSRV